MLVYTVTTDRADYDASTKSCGTFAVVAPSEAARRPPAPRLTRLGRPARGTGNWHSWKVTALDIAGNSASSLRG